MRAAVLTREYPPEVYGGAGVHVDFLVRELRRLIDVEVHCFGESRGDAHAYQPVPQLDSANAALQHLSVDLLMAAGVGPQVDVVHSHTWYANLAGHLAATLHGVPHVVTAHSLEPLRPWKAEQLGGGYALSCWAERTGFESAAAVIAVSEGMRADVLRTYRGVDPQRVHVIGNGIDTALYRPVSAPETLARYGVDPAVPYVLYIGRITRQKGLPHLLSAAHHLAPGVRLVLAASAPDTRQIAEEVSAGIDAVRAQRGEDSVVWLRDMLPREDVIALLSHAAVFCCPSTYEPLGIVNLEAMACRTAVVASDVGGIPEVVADGVTGALVHYDEADPETYRNDLASALNRLATDPDAAAAMGAAGRHRAVTEFGWDTVAARTATLYRSL